VSVVKQEEGHGSSMALARAPAIGQNPEPEAPTETRARISEHPDVRDAAVRDARAVTPDALISAAPAPDASSLDDFYRSVATVSFTLLGLWWLVVHGRYQRGEGARRQRRHAYGIVLFFLLPGVMSLISSINAELSTLWRVAFGVCAAIGVVEFALYLRTGGDRTLAAVALRICGTTLYAFIAVVAIDPTLVAEAGLQLTPQEVESVLLGLLILVGANLAWLGLTESVEAAGA
jgi:hypothetical protein